MLFQAMAWQQAPALVARLQLFIRARLASRALLTGDRLPSIRQFATNMGVALSTVVEAYDRLAAEDLIRSRRGSGFYVTGTGLPPMTLMTAGAPRERAIDPFWVSASTRYPRPRRVRNATRREPGVSPGKVSARRSSFQACKREPCRC